MSYCFNPRCCQFNDDARNKCHSCGASLWLQQRYKGVKLLNKSQLALTIEVVDVIERSHCERDNSSNKVLKLLLTHYPKAVKLFKQEAEVLTKVSHQGIPTLAKDGYFSFQPEWSNHPVHCLVINKVPGLDLEQWLKQQNRTIDRKQAISWLKQLLDILSQLHQQQYFHRDIKPSNIILQPNGQLTLIDFGAARKVTATYLGKIGVERGVTSIGTPGYVAPEQIDGTALPQSDFFGLGRTLVHLLTGKHPQELPKNIDTREIIWRDLAPQVSVSLADAIDLMMHPSPGKRPINVEAINTLLARVEQFPHQPLVKSHKLKLSLPILVGIIFLPLSTVGLLSLGNGFKQNLATEKTADTPLCNNLSCVNRDPIDNKCDRDAQTITSTIANYKLGNELMAYRIEVRYSPKCKAVWARTEAPYRSSHYIEDREGNIYGRADVIKDGWNRHYADMAPGENIQIRACAKPPLGEKSCTNFVRL